MLPDVELLIHQCECHSYNPDVHYDVIICPVHCLLMATTPINATKHEHVPFLL